MNKSDSIGQLATALAKAQGELRPASKDATNPFLKNRFADLGSVIEAVRPTLAKYELSFVQIPVTEGETVGIETVLLHSSGEWLGGAVYLPLDDEKGISRSQVAGKVITYLRRYSLSAVLGVYADEDTDGQASGQRRVTPPANVDRKTGEIKATPAPAPVYNRDARVAVLKGLRAQQTELLKARGETLTPITADRVKAMTQDEIEQLIVQTESNLTDLRAAQPTNGNGHSAGR